MCPLPAWEWSDAARNYYFLCKVHTMWLQFKNLAFSSESQASFMIYSILSHSRFKTILHRIGKMLLGMLKLGQTPQRYLDGVWPFWDWVEGSYSRVGLKVKNHFLKHSGGEGRAGLSTVLSVQKSWDYLYFESNPICKLAARGKWRRQLAKANLESI